MVNMSYNNTNETYVHNMHMTMCAHAHTHTSCVMYPLLVQAIFLRKAVNFDMNVM